ncbi:hypothetical protein [Paenibacillus xylanexedens]|uniref:hypothetical protein n=1 Tax=Paenibacillus xylanexedens TaxID=528191 RepID=UPI003B010BC9
MKCGEFMPLIDNYLLDNYGLEGPKITSKYRTVGINQENSTITMQPNVSNQIMYLLATIPSGSDVVSIGPVSASAMSMYYSSNTSTTTLRLAVIDANGIIFPISALASSSAVTYASIQVDLNASARAIATNGTVTLSYGNSIPWGPNIFPKPVQFDKNAGDMRVVLVASSASSSSTITYGFINAVIVSA